METAQCPASMVVGFQKGPGGYRDQLEGSGECAMPF